MSVSPEGFESQVAIVTGAARGIGEAIARRLAGMGIRVVLVARDKARLETVRAAIEAAGGKAEAFPCDLRDEKSVVALGAHLREKHGRCDVLVNNAGIGKTGKPLHETSIEEWDDLMSTNLRGPFLTIKAVAPLMIERQSGHIINISSLAGKNPLPNGTAYSASKWGLNGLTYSVAEELRQYNIRVSVVAPGSVNTGFGGRGDGFKEESWKVKPDDVASVVEMLVKQAPQSFVSEVLIRPTKKAAG
jgi:3-oxoacyl-[acyl-carrier protein] reductase